MPKKSENPAGCGAHGELSAGGELSDRIDQTNDVLHLLRRKRADDVDGLNRYERAFRTGVFEWGCENTEIWQQLEFEEVVTRIRTDPTRLDQVDLTDVLDLNADVVVAVVLTDHDHSQVVCDLNVHDRLAWLSGHSVAGVLDRPGELFESCSGSCVHLASFYSLDVGIFYDKSLE